MHGSHVTGFANTTTAMVKYLSEKSGATRNQLNLLPGYLDPADMRELGIQSVMFPDASELIGICFLARPLVLDAARVQKHCC